MAAIAVVQAQPTGTALTFAAASGGGDTVAAGAGAAVVLHVINGDGTAKTVTIVRPGNDAYSIAVPDITRSVPAGAQWVFELKPEFRDPATGLVNITYSAVTSVTVAAARV